MTAPSRVLRLVLAVVVLAASAAHADPQVVLLRSDASAAFFKANGGDYQRLVNPWRQLFKRNAIKALELRASELASQKGPGVLVLASTVALAESERQAIRSRLAAGWSVLGTWSTGVRSGKGEWLGYGFIEEIFAAQAVPDLPPPSKDDRFLLPFGETPLTHALPAGKRIYLAPAAEPLLRANARNGAARISNWVRDVRAPGALLAVAAFSESAGARRAYFGFPETSWTGAHLAEIDALAIGTLDWLRRKPIVVKAAWPHPHEAAMLIEMDTEDKFRNALNFAEQLERSGIRGTFFVLTSEAIKHPDIVKRLAARHEIAYHAEVHNGFAKVEPKEQESRLRTMIDHMRQLVPDVSAIKGFRAPLEEYDANTEKLLRALGLTYIAGSPDSRDDALPGFSTAEPGVAPGSALVVLPRTWLDDINLLKMAMLEKEPAEKVMLASLDATIMARGLGLLSLHTQNFARGGALDRALPRVLEAMAKKRDVVWAAPGDAIGRWWRDREAVQLAATREARGVRVQLKAARGPIERLRLLVFPPGSEPPKVDGLPGARVEKLDAHRWAVVLPALRAGETTLRISF